MNGNVIITGSLTSSLDANISTITVGRGNGSVASNTAIGYRSIYSNTSGQYDTAVGYESLRNNTSGARNTAVGFYSLRSNTTGYYNTSVGFESLYSNTTGFYNTAVGLQSIRSNTTGVRNTAVGYESIRNNTMGSNNTAVGFRSLNSNTTADGNTAVGFYSLKSNTTGYDNTAVGSGSLQSNTTGYYNVAVGTQALKTSTTGTNNVAVGYFSINANTTGHSNTATGHNSLRRNTTGYNNAAFGLQSLSFNTTGYYNVSVGINSLQTNTTGNRNTANGAYSLYSNTTGNSNTAYGHYSLFSNTTATGNVAIGSASLYDNTTGTYNTIIGANTGRGITTGDYNTIIGSQVTGLSSSLSNTIILADGQGNIRMYVSSSGNVGIGTITPAQKLSVNGTMQWAQTTDAGYSGYLTNASTNAAYNPAITRNLIGSTGSTYTIAHGDMDAYAGIQFGVSGTTTNAGNISFFAASGTFATNESVTPVARMFIANTGDVSISSTTAGASGAGALVVSGGISAGNSGSAASYFGGNITVNAQILTPVGSNLALNPNTGLVTIGGVLQASGVGTSTFAGAVMAPSLTSPAATNLTLGTTNSGAAITVATTNKVGIGTTTPGLYDGESNDLVVFRTATAGITIAVSDTTSRAAIRFADGTTGSEAYRGGIEYDHGTGSGGTADSLHFRTAAALRMSINGSGNVGIGTTTPAYKLEVSGSFAALSKSFVINHPTKSGMKLQHGVVEGPEHTIFVRGKTTSNTITLPEYWTGLVHEDTITVHLTSIGKHQNLVVTYVDIHEIKIENQNSWNTNINCYYIVQAERKDIPKLVVEY